MSVWRGASEPLCLPRGCETQRRGHAVPGTTAFLGVGFQGWIRKTSFLWWWGLRGNPSGVERWAQAPVSVSVWPHALWTVH